MSTLSDVSLPIELAVDFGTCNTVAVVHYPDGRVLPLIIDGSPLLPSAVFVDEDGGIVVGRDAIHAAQTGPHRFEPNPKHRIDDRTVLLGDREVPIGDLFTAVLDRVRREYQIVVGAAPRRTVVTHPAAWRSVRLLTLRDAAERAGLGAIETVSEPVAAATYFTEQLGHRVPLGAPVLVFDVGGGTFDTSVVRRTPGGFEVLAVDGLNDFGGLDIDERIAQALRERHPDEETWTRLLDRDDAASRRQHRVFRDDVRELKERLSRSTTASIHIPVLGVDSHMTRDELDTLIRPMLERAAGLTTAVLRISGVDPASLAGVFGVGGGSRMPLVATVLHAAVGVAPTLFGQPELVVAQGALAAAGAPGGIVTPPPVSAPPTSAPPVSAPPPLPALAGDTAPPVSPPPLPALAGDVPTPSTPPPSSYPDGTPAPDGYGPPTVTPGSGIPDGTPPGPYSAPYPPMHVGPPTGPMPGMPFVPPPPRRNTGVVLTAVLAVLVVAAIAVVLVIDNLRGDPSTEANDPTPSPTPSLAEDVAGTFSRHSDDVHSVEVIRHDDRWLAVSAGFDQVLVWDVETREVVHSFLEHEGRVEATTITIDGAPAVVSYVNSNPSGPIIVWDPLTGEERWRLDVDLDPSDQFYTAVNDLATGIDNNGRPIATAVLYIGDEDDEDWIDRAVVTWDLDEGYEISRGDIKSYGWISTAIMNGDLVAVVPDDAGDEEDPQTVIWDLDSGRERYRIDLEDTGRYGLVVAELDRLPVTIAARQGEQIVVRRLDDGSVLWVYDGHDGAKEKAFAACDWDGLPVVVSADEDGQVHVWSVGEDVVVSNDVGSAAVSSVTCVEADGRLVVLAGAGDDVAILDFGRR